MKRIGPTYAALEDAVNRRGRPERMRWTMSCYVDCLGAVRLELACACGDAAWVVVADNVDVAAKVVTERQ